LEADVSAADGQGQSEESAKRRVTELAGRSPGEYFVFSRETEEIVINTAPRMYELAIPTPAFSRAGDMISILFV